MKKQQYFSVQINFSAKFRISRTKQTNWWTVMKLLLAVAAHILIRIFAAKLDGPF